MFGWVQSERPNSTRVQRVRLEIEEIRRKFYYSLKSLVPLATNKESLLSFLSTTSKLIVCIGALQWTISHQNMYKY